MFQVSGGSVEVEQLHGIQACQTDDVLKRNWLSKSGLNWNHSHTYIVQSQMSRMALVFGNCKISILKYFDRKYINVKTNA